MFALNLGLIGNEMGGEINFLPSSLITGIIMTEYIFNPSKPYL